MSKETTTNIRVELKTKSRLESLMMYGETHTQALEMLLWIIDRVGYRGLAEAVGGRNVHPRFSEEEDAAIRARLAGAKARRAEGRK